MRSLVLAILLIASHCQAQDGTGGFLGVSIGLGQPTGKFAGSRLDSASGSGFANTGFSFASQFAFQFTKYGGFSLMYGYNGNAVNDEALASEHKKQYYNKEFVVHSRSWEKHTFMGGYFFNKQVPAERQTFIDFSALVGYTRVTSPSTIVSHTGLNPLYFVYGSTKGNGLAGMLFLGLRTALSGNVAFHVQASYSKCKAVFAHTVYNKSFEQEITILALNLGVAFCY